ncbi:MULTISPECIES: helix-turn-helix domain-containing protein [Cyanophyceae]|uniref:AraC family transcriptional regulator n=1 Tax=Cyanophyceae TaxID=3028117 RepID=UPI0016833F8E|nr:MULTISPECIES: helix-turn-helix domain-containing protein [Cyanophyceae]MBD1919363.1 helix-turn-helix domain-containing protein [Phormidium sp. FACHB-77]MBD2054373.1 helix-turn-helix domain-containing protein [Leptolyngbya sp. FACHB-60]
MAFNAREMIAPPSPALREVVNHYWLCLNNSSPAYVAVPDGSIDIAFRVDRTSISSWVHGTTTARVDIPLDQQCHYFGIRFKPGQSRHFIQASAYELTNTYEVTQGLLKFSLERFTEAVLMGNIVQYFNRVLEAHVAQLSPSLQPIDQSIRLIEAAHGAVPIREAAEVFGQSHRQFERVFLETVGVPAKTFAKIVRFQHTARLITSSSKFSLSYIAAELNYFDQSHMSHDFKRLAGISPNQFLQAHKAPLQDPFPKQALQKLSLAEIAS